MDEYRKLRLLVEEYQMHVIQAIGTAETLRLISPKETERVAAGVKAEALRADLKRIDAALAEANVSERSS